MLNRAVENFLGRKALKRAAENFLVEKALKHTMKIFLCRCDITDKGIQQNPYK
ncbi:MAG: hypothetical protein RR253_03900 [Oscillospiraceae bacterium]